MLKQDVLFMSTCLSKDVQWPETMLSILVTFPYIHWVKETDWDADVELCKNKLWWNINKIWHCFQNVFDMSSVANRGFSRGKRQLQTEWANQLFGKIYAQNCIKMRNFGKIDWHAFGIIHLRSLSFPPPKDAKSLNVTKGGEEKDGRWNRLLKVIFNRKKRCETEISCKNRKEKKPCPHVAQDVQMVSPCTEVSVFSSDFYSNLSQFIVS